ncbi:MAG: hypothetical protein ACUVUP_02430 [Thermaceae bacterium]
MRLVGLLEEALERLGAPREATFGQKVNSEVVKDFLYGLQDREALHQGLYQLLEVRNQVVHERLEVPAWALEEGERVLRRLLHELERARLYTQKELEERRAVFTQPPPVLEPVATPLEPLPFSPPREPEGPVRLSFPRRRIKAAPLRLPRRLLP